MPLSTGHKGIDIRQTANRLIFDALLQDTSGSLVTTGTTKLYLYELQSDYTLNSYDFSNNTFTSGVLTNAYSTLTHQRTCGNTVNTGVWTSGLTTLTGFSNSGIYYTHVNHTNAFPNDQMRKFQFGSEQGDVIVNSSNYVQVDMKNIDGSTVHNYDGTLAAVTDDTDITFPATDAYGSAVPNDARYEYSVFRLVGGSGAGQHLFTTTKTGTRKFGFVDAWTPVNPSTDTTYLLTGSWRANMETWLGSVPNALLNGDVKSYTTNTSGIADAVLMRNVSGVEQMMPEHCLGTIVLAALENSISGTTLTIKRTNGTTTHFTKTVTVDAAADPITGIQ